MNLFQLLFRRQSKNTRASMHNIFQEPAAVSQFMDAGRVHDILRQAENGDMRDFFSLGRDIVSGHGHTLAEFGKRKLAILAETQTFPPADPDDPVQVALSRSIGNHLESLPTWYAAMIHLLDSTLFPVAVLKKVFRESFRPGWRYELADLIPVPYHQLSWESGTLMIRDVDDMGNLTGTSHAPDPLRYVIHRGHLLTSSPDTWGGPMRAVMFWWLFSTQNRDWWVRFLERFGAPFLEGTYDKSDDTSRILLEQAFNSATRLFGIAVPDDASVKIHQANASQGGDAFEQFRKAANGEISKIIVGQTSSAEIQTSGLGDSQGAAQAGVRSDLRQFDAIMLAFTVRTQILAPLCQVNGWNVECPRIAWGGDDVADLATLSEVIERLSNAGIAITDDGIDALSKRVSLPLTRQGAPQPGLGVLSALSAPPNGRTLAASSSAAADAVDALASVSAQDFAEAMRLTLEPLAAIVSESTDIADLERRLTAAIPGLDPSRAARIAESALVSASANAATLFRPR